MLKRLRLAAAALFVGIFAGPAQAQVPDPYARQLAQQLSRIDQIVGESDFSRAAGPFAGALTPQHTRAYRLTLRAGQDYRIVAVCDARCSDIDLRLFDPRGRLMAQDVLRDDVPVVNVRPPVTGAHSIEVVMYGCSADPCYFALNVYAR